MNSLEHLGMIMMKIMQGDEMYIDLDSGTFDGRIFLTQEEKEILQDAKGLL